MNHNWDWLRKLFRRKRLPEFRCRFCGDLSFTPEDSPGSQCCRFCAMEMEHLSAIREEHRERNAKLRGAKQ